MAGRVGPYEVLGEVERGPGYALYRANHVELGRPVLIKVLQAGAAAPPAARQRFAEEARRLVALAHPNLQPVLAVGEAQGVPYLALGALEAQRMSALLAQRAEPLGVAVAVKLALQLAHAVQVVHAAGLLHRDVCPASVLMTPQGTPVLTDFALSKELGQAAPWGGTAGYAAPEQALGRADLVSAATDVYGLGTVLYALLVGRPPFLDASPEQLRARVASEPPPAPRALRPDLPAALEAVCLRALAKEPAARFASAQALGQALAGALPPVAAPALELAPPRAAAAPAAGEQGGPEEAALDEPPAARGSSAEAARGPERPRAPLLLGAAAAAAVLVGGALALLAGGGSAEPSARSPEEPAREDEAPASEVRADPRAPAAPSALDRQLAAGQLEEGLARLARGRADEALRAFDSALALDPELARAYHERGNARYLLGDYAAAVADYTAALTRAPDAPEPYHNRGAAHESLGRPAEAIADYRRFLELSPDHPEAPGVRADLERLER